MGKASAPKPVIDLVERFGRNRDAYLSGSYNETQIRREFIDPLFEALPKLYPPKSPYEFSVIGIEILGEVYEQFLGKVIRLTPGHQAKVEEKPEVRKAGGVHYTPQYIVNYIVKNTVGRLHKGGTPAHLTSRAGFFIMAAWNSIRPGLNERMMSMATRNPTATRPGREQAERSQ